MRVYTILFLSFLDGRESRVQERMINHTMQPMFKLEHRAVAFIICRRYGKIAINNHVLTNGPSVLR